MTNVNVDPDGWIVPKKKRGERKSGFDVRVSRVLYSRAQDGTEIHGSSVQLSEKIMAQMRWIAGDRVAAKVDGDVLMLKRHTSGFKFTPYASDADGRKLLDGKPCKCTVKINLDVVQDTVFLTAEDVAADGLLLLIPLTGGE